MKLSQFLIFVVAVAGMFFIFGLMSQEASVNYPDSNINDSEWLGKYDYSEQINESISPLQTAISDIGDDSKGWFSQVTSGIIAIPTAVIALPTLFFQTVANGGRIVAGTFTTLKIPSQLVTIVLIMIFIWIIFKLVEIYNKWQI
jgi:hypothetical protein